MEDDKEDKKHESKRPAIADWAKHIERSLSKEKDKHNETPPSLTNGSGSSNSSSTSGSSTSGSSPTQQQIKNMKISTGILIGVMVILFLLLLIYAYFNMSGGKDEDVQALLAKQESSDGIEYLGPQSVLFLPFTSVTQDDTALVNQSLQPKIGSELPLAPTFDPQAQAPPSVLVSS